MHYENKIYDITALEMFKRLEVFFVREQIIGDTFAKKMKCFRGKFSGKSATARKAVKLMGEINGERIKIAHANTDDARLSVAPAPVLGTLAEFRKFRQNCRDLEDILGKPPLKMRRSLTMTEIMIPTLHYKMGNIGDIIKHGALAEFVEWWVCNQRSELTFADPFGGCPWDDLAKTHFASVRPSLAGTALYRAYEKMGGKYTGKYLCSSHLVRQMHLQQSQPPRRIIVSDKSEDARDNLRTSGLNVVKFSDDYDGYALLNEGVFSKHKSDCILLDPYGDFLREEWRSGGEKLQKIHKLTEKHKSLWVILFVLDIWPEERKHTRRSVQETHESYVASRDEKFKDKAVYLHCPKASQSPAGKKSKYDSEVLLISEKLRDKSNADVKDLLRRLEAFAGMATNALAKEKGLVLADGGEVKYKEV